MTGCLVKILLLCLLKDGMSMATVWDDEDFFRYCSPSRCDKYGSKPAWFLQDNLYIAVWRSHITEAPLPKSRQNIAKIKTPFCSHRQWRGWSKLVTSGLCTPDRTVGQATEGPSWWWSSTKGEKAWLFCVVIVCFHFVPTRGGRQTVGEKTPPSSKEGGTPKTPKGEHVSRAPKKESSLDPLG